MKGFRCIRQAQLHFEQAQATVPAGPGMAGETPADAPEYPYQKQDGAPADHKPIPFPGLSPDTNSKTRTP
jgi:hypothetical protein